MIISGVFGVKEDDADDDDEVSVFMFSNLGIPMSVFVFKRFRINLLAENTKKINTETEKQKKQKKIHFFQLMLRREKKIGNSFRKKYVGVFYSGASLKVMMA